MMPGRTGLDLPVGEPKLTPVTIGDEYLSLIFQEMQAIRALLSPQATGDSGEVALRETQDAAPKKPAHRDAVRAAKKGE